MPGSPRARIRKLLEEGDVAGAEIVAVRHEIDFTEFAKWMPDPETGPRRPVRDKTTRADIPPDGAASEIYDRRAAEAVMASGGTVSGTIRRLGFDAKNMKATDRTSLFHNVTTRPGVIDIIMKRRGDIDRNWDRVCARMISIALDSPNESNAIQAAWFVAKVGGKMLEPSKQGSKHVHIHNLLLKTNDGSVPQAELAEMYDTLEGAFAHEPGDPVPADSGIPLSPGQS